MKNGNTLNIPDSYGGFILSCGCGSGKTTMYKDIIQYHWEEGILYTVDSRKECLSMYHFIIDTIIPQEPSLNPSDVFMMFTKSSETQEEIMAEKNLLDYKQNPGILLSKKILIIPHPRLFCDIPGYFLVYNPSLNELPVFDGDFKTLMNRDDLRKWILIDETPQFFKAFAKLPGWVPLAFSGKEEKGIRETYNKRIKGMEFDLFREDKTKLGNLKHETVLKMLSFWVPQWLNKEQENSYVIQFSPKDLAQPEMGTHLYLAEGAGDVLFDGISGFKLIDVPKKYKSKLELKQFSFTLDRKTTPGELVKTTFLNTLKGIIEGEPGKSLIVVWKDFHGQNALEDSEASNESKWRDEVKAGLIELEIPESKFSITYYGASDCKSTNDYRDCGSIICCGKWLLPNSASEKLNEGYDCYCNSQDYNLYQYVQLISRIGLRNNTGETYRMYYSEDFLDKKGTFPLGNRLLEYINNNHLISSVAKVPHWIQKLNSIKNGKIQRQGIEKLISSGYLCINDFSGTSLKNLDIKLSAIAKIIPHSKKPRRSDYTALVNVLNALGVILKIT